MTSRDGGSEAELVAAARAARELAYAPYSRYRVGCALLADGAVHQGANVENASFGLSICAERVACANAALAGVRELELVCVATATSPPAAPCGMCLQTLTEFCSDPRLLRIILINAMGERRDFTLAELIPHAFDKRQLTTDEP